jgi:LysR family glycine cleavage system transcriptional activator
MTRNISIKGLRTFCVAAELESFRAAAEQLFLTASAVSHQIKSLESELGKKLFERGSRSITLTADGELLYADIYPLLRQLDDVANRHRSDTTRTRLKISVQPFFASEVFVPRLKHFQALHPDIDIAVDTSDESSEKHPTTSDVSIRVFKSPPKNLACERLFPLTLAPAASPEFYDRTKVVGNRITSDFPIIIHESRPHAWRQWERASGVSLPRNAPTTRLDSMIAVVRAAERGLGAALVPLRLSDAWFQSSSLVHLFDTELPTDDAFYVVHDRDHEDLPTLKLFRDWAVAEFGEAA